MFLKSMIEFGGFELNHHWHGINMLSVLECALLASCLCTLSALFARYIRKSKRLTVLSLVGALSFATAAYAANTALSALSASGALAGANLIYVVQTAGVGGVKATMTQVATFINSLFSGDFTCTSGGACTLKNTGPGATGPIGTGTTIPVITIDAQGRTTALTSVAVTPTPQGNLTGDVTSAGLATTLTNGPVIAKVLTGYTSGAGTVSSADSILSALQKINGNDALKAPLASPALTGTPTAPTATVGTNTTQLATTAFVIANAGSGTGANPTATAGPTANNGTAGTFMRSDASPAVQTCTTSQPGLCQPDGSTITVSAGIIKAVPGVTSRTITTSTGDTILSTDRGNIVFYNSSSANAVSQPAPSGSFAAGFFTTLCNINTGTPTVTPGSGTIDNGATYPIPTGTAASPSCISYQSDGTNFNAVDLQASYGTSVQAALAKALSSAGGLTSTIFHGTAALGTSAIGSGACATAVNVTAANVATTDVVTAGFAADPTATTGFLPTAMLTIVPYVASAGNIGIKVCNLTGSSITPSALTINVSAVR